MPGDSAAVRACDGESAGWCFRVRFPAAASPIGGGNRQTIIMENDNDTVMTEAEPAGVAELPVFVFSEVAAAIREDRVIMDRDGVMMVADEDACTSRVRAVDCDGSPMETILRLANGALTELVHRAMCMDPRAWAVLAEWMARGERRDELQKCVPELIRVAIEQDKAEEGGEA